MKNLRFAILAAAAVLPGCMTLESIPAALGIRPASTDYGPFKQDRAEVWKAVREVLYSEGFKFEEVDREEWLLETDWDDFGSGMYMGNKRYRIHMELVDGPYPGTTIMELCAEAERNSSRDFIEPENEAWESIGADHEYEEIIYHQVLTKLLKQKDPYYDIKRRLEAEEARKPKKPIDYADPNR
jgi:hypothetical protein